jgi:hypothetical protein
MSSNGSLLAVMHSRNDLLTPQVPRKVADVVVVVVAVVVVDVVVVVVRIAAGRCCLRAGVPRQACGSMTAALHGCQRRAFSSQRYIVQLTVGVAVVEATCRAGIGSIFRSAHLLIGKMCRRRAEALMGRH